MALAAQKLLAARPRPSALSPYIFMTDPQRVPDPVTTVRALPDGITIIYRHFGKNGHGALAETLREITTAKNQQFLIGHDPELASAIGANGVHFRRDADVLAPRLWREKRPDWIISMAGLKGEQTYHRSLEVLDGLLVSSVFYSKSPSAGDPIGVDRFTEISRKLPVPVFALGGVKATNADELVGSGAAGVAGIDGLI